MQVLTGDQVLIGGFIITGNAPKEVILRGIGPSLNAPDITNPLADPVLELRAGDGTLISMNDNWRDTQEAEITASGLQPSNDLESAIIETLDPGSYTAIVSGKNDVTGVGLVEGYDLDAAAESELANISTRGFVETGSNVLIGGFILGGQGDSASVVVRAIGPALTQFGIDGALPDPTLEVRNIQGTLVRSNDNWMDDPNAGDLPVNLQPTEDLESAVIISLEAGAYTAIVAGKDGVTGIGLVEVYNIQ